MENQTAENIRLSQKEQRSPLLAIRRKCLECVCGSPKEVRLCPSNDCPNWRFRFGQMPDTARKQGKNVSVIS